MISFGGKLFNFQVLLHLQYRDELLFLLITENILRNKYKYPDGMSKRKS